MVSTQAVHSSIGLRNFTDCRPSTSSECGSSCSTSSSSTVVRSSGRVRFNRQSTSEENVWSFSRGFSHWNGERNGKNVATSGKSGDSARVFGARALASDGDAAGIGGKRGGHESRAAVLRRILAEPGVHLGPACFDALSARLVEQAGFSFTFMSGFAVAAARLGAPDMGLLSYGEVLDQGRLICDAVSIPVVGDGDNGYGNVLNVKRTVKGFVQAGFAGILIEDQDSPKSCGHFSGKKVVSREEALRRIKAVVDARDECSSDIVIFARSDARQAESLEEALWRVEQFAALGADVIFIDALASEEELTAFCKVAPGTPKMANMLEGGGRTPVLSPQELEALGFKLVAYPLSLIGVAMQAMKDALYGLRTGQLPAQDRLPVFEQMKSTLGIEHYLHEEKRYEEPVVIAPTTSGPVDFKNEIAEEPYVIESEVSEEIKTTEAEVVDTVTNFISGSGDGAGYRGVSDTLKSISERSLRVRITGRDGVVKLDVEVPAGFLEPLASGIPVFAGVNIRQLLEESLSKLSGGSGGGRTLVDISTRNGERVQIILVQPFERI
ncbi:hypothetical protein R1flu_002819 [Riccia fluitans]|uniref:Isocitrate lyase n=1 Tax=Riccia fluitans TaxID=41844 RepID=A0ABD1Y858_9MARC